MEKEPKKHIQICKENIQLKEKGKRIIYNLLVYMYGIQRTGIYEDPLTQPENSDTISVTVNFSGRTCTP